MSERKMSPKGFLHKSGQKAANSAIGFLQAHREWLLTGEVSNVTSPIIEKLDARELMPTSALAAIRSAVMDHIKVSEANKAFDAIHKVEDSKPKKHFAQVYDMYGSICTRVNTKGEEEELRKDFALGQDAERWCDRRLFEQAAGAYATIEHVATSQESRIERDESMARLFKKPRAPIMKGQSKSAGKLSFGVKAKQDHASFSRG